MIRWRLPLTEATDLTQAASLSAYMVRSTIERNACRGRQPGLFCSPRCAVGARLASDTEVAERFAAWLKEHLGSRQPVFVSDNPAYD